MPDICQIYARYMLWYMWYGPYCHPSHYDSPYDGFPNPYGSIDDCCTLWHINDHLDPNDTNTDSHRYYGVAHYSIWANDR